MLITNLEMKDKKVMVYIDYEYMFTLYNNEIKKYRIELNSEIEEDIIIYIQNEVILKRAKEKALNILKYMDRTEYELKQKLKNDGYNNYIIKLVMDYLKDYNYINDERYVYQYINCKGSKKSKFQIRQELLRKGVSKDYIDSCYENIEIDEEEIFLNLFEKKIRKIDYLDQKEINKIYRFFIKKGFSNSMITKYINQYKQK